MLRYSSLALIMLLLSHPAMAGSCFVKKKLGYEVPNTKIQGVITIASSLHPNGQQMVYPIMKLNTPIDTFSSSEELSPNVPEKCVREVQLFSHNATIQKRLMNSQSESVSARGKLFHSHTAWHNRAVLMEVDTMLVKARK